jgi:hypothetical protein
MRPTGMSVESRMRGNVHVRFGRRLGENGPAERPEPRPGPTKLPDPSFEPDPADPASSARSAGARHP